MVKSIIRNLVIALLTMWVSFSVNAAGDEHVSIRTATMVDALSEIERSDASFPQYSALIEEIFSGNKILKQAEPVLSGYLFSSGNHAGKRYLIGEISKTGSKTSVAYLTRLLQHDETACLALMSLEGIPDPAVYKSLRTAFPGVTPEIQAGILSVLGNRADAGSAGFIAGHTGHADRQLSRAAISALGKIGTLKATRHLGRAIKSGNHPEQQLLADALFESAESLTAAGRPQDAFKIYKLVYDENPSGLTALAAIRGMIITTPGNPVNLLIEHLENSPEDLTRELTGLARLLPPSDNMATLLLNAGTLSDETKIRLIMVMAYRNDRSIYEEALAFTGHENPVYRESAIHALGKIADVSDVQLLLEIASARSGREQDIARDGLYRIQGSEVDSVILDKTVNAGDKLSIELVKAIGERNIAQGYAVLIQKAKSNDQEVKIGSYRSLARVASDENMGEIIELLLETANNREIQEIERTIYMVLTRENPDAPRTGTIVTYLEKTPESDKKAKLIPLIGSFKNPDDLEILLDLLDSDEPVLKLSAIRALSEWPDSGPMKKFRDIITRSDDARVKILALRGYNQVIVNDKNLSNDKKARELLFALNHAPNLNEMKLVVSAFGNVPSPGSLQILVDHLENRDIGPELEAAIMKIVPDLLPADREGTLSELKRAMQQTGNTEFKEWITKLD
jgi:HEAT repeat protein